MDGFDATTGTSDWGGPSRWTAIEYLDYVSEELPPYAPTKPGDVWSFGMTCLVWRHFICDLDCAEGHLGTLVWKAALLRHEEGARARHDLEGSASFVSAPKETRLYERIGEDTNDMHSFLGQGAEV